MVLHRIKHISTSVLVLIITPLTLYAAPPDDIQLKPGDTVEMPSRQLSPAEAKAMQNQLQETHKEIHRFGEQREAAIKELQNPRLSSIERIRIQQEIEKLGNGMTKNLKATDYISRYSRMIAKAEKTLKISRIGLLKTVNRANGFLNFLAAKQKLDELTMTQEKFYEEVEVLINIRKEIEQGIKQAQQNVRDIEVIMSNIREIWRTSGIIPRDSVQNVNKLREQAEQLKKMIKELEKKAEEINGEILNMFPQNHII